MSKPHPNGETGPKTAGFPHQTNHPHHPRQQMKFNLRDYQKRFCRRVVDAFDGKVNNTPFTKLLGIGATGCGKTIMASALIYYWTKQSPDNRILFLADSDELCDQSIDKLRKSTGLIADLEKADSRASLMSNVVVGSIQTMGRPNRLKRWAPDHYDYVIADEAHMSMADSWQRVLNHFHGGGANILGVTATPERGDKKSLMRFYEHVADEIPMKELIQAKHLSPITVQTLPLEIKIQSQVKGEGDADDIAAELEAYYHAIIDQIEAHAKERKKILWFHPSRAASRKFTQLLMERGHTAAHVDGESLDRKEILEAFNIGRFRHLNNCQMLTKGYDQPDIDAIVILKPTKNRTNYIQMAGRGTRLFCPHGCPEWCDHHDRKHDILLFDFLWEFAEHDVMGPADLITDAPEQKAAVAKALKEGKPLDLIDTDEFITSEREQDLLDKLKRQRGKRGSKVDALTFSALLHQPTLLDYEPVAHWHTAPVSHAQAAALDKIGLDPTTLRDRGHASAVMDAIVAQRENGLATLKQIKHLTEAGYQDAHKMTFQQASAALDELFSKR